MSEPADVAMTRAAYDLVAADYAESLRSALATTPLDRAVLAAFAEVVQAAGLGPVADLGCGPGRVTAHLEGLGVSAFGIDLSPAMIAIARQAYPHLHFQEGTMAALDLPDGGPGGVVSWYSVIHTPPERLPGIFAEFRRVLAPGGQLLLAFQVGDERIRLEQAYGHRLSLEAYRFLPDQVAKLLGQVGLVVQARWVREPGELENVPQAFLLARSTGPSGG